MAPPPPPAPLFVEPPFGDVAVKTAAPECRGGGGGGGAIPPAALGCRGRRW